MATTAAAEELATRLLEQIYAKSIENNKQQRIFEQQREVIIMDDGHIVSPTCLKHLPTISSQMLDNDDDDDDELQDSVDYGAEGSQDAEWDEEE